MVECSNMEKSPKNAQTPDGREEPFVPKQNDPPREEVPRGSQRTPDGVAVKLATHYSYLGYKWIRRLIRNAPQVLAELHIQDLLGELKYFVCNHPLAAALAAIIAVACGVPIFIFVTFAVITLIFTFGAFLIIEGVVLAAGSFALLLCLSSLAVGFVTLGFFGGLLYVTYVQVERQLRVNGFSRESMQSISTDLPQVLASLRNLSHSNQQHHGRVSQSSHSSNGHSHQHSKC